MNKFTRADLLPGAALWGLGSGLDTEARRLMRDYAHYVLSCVDVDFDGENGTAYAFISTGDLCNDALIPHCLRIRTRRIPKRMRKA